MIVNVSVSVNLEGRKVNTGESGEKENKGECVKERGDARRVWRRGSANWLLPPWNGTAWLLLKFPILHTPLV